jgi:alpha-mannosidase
VRAEGGKHALVGFKRAEDGRGAILHFYEPHGARGRCALRFALPMQRAERTNLIEETEGPVDVEDDALRFEVRPFEVVTLRVEFG